MWWKLFQAAVFVAVGGGMATITEPHGAAGASIAMFAYLASWGATNALSWSIDRWRSWRRPSTTEARAPAGRR